MNFFKLYIYSILFLLIYCQLSVLSPYSLVKQLYNRQIEMAYGKVGPLTNFYIRGQLILETITENQDACSPLTGLNLMKKNGTIYDENFKILLAYRGSCSFSQKARYAQNAGASMLIVINKGDTPINEVIFTDDSHDIYIPVALINNYDGKILENYIKFNLDSKILVDVNFFPNKLRNFVDLKFFFSSSEPRAYDLIGNMTKYLDKFGSQVKFTPYYVIHQDPFYAEDNAKDKINCISRGIYCYFPKETTIIKEGRKILLEDIRQKCMFSLSKEKSTSLYYEYMNTFFKNFILSKEKLTEFCSKNTLEKLGYSQNYLDKCIANSFGVKDLGDPSYIDRENKLLRGEYDEILKYKLTSFPAVVINDKILKGLIKEETIVMQLCNYVKIKPSFCPYITGFIDEHRKNELRNKKIVYFLIILIIFINISLFFMCRKYIIKKINDRVNSSNIDIENRISNVINNYFALKNSSNDYKSFDNKNSNSSQVIEMQEGSVHTI